MPMERNMQRLRTSQRMKTSRMRMKKLHLRNVFKPCLGYFLRGGVKQIAIFNAFLAVTNAVIFTAPILNRTPGNMTKTERTIAMEFWCYYYFFWAAEFILSIMLYRASKHHDAGACRNWLWLQLLGYGTFFICWTVHVSWLEGVLLIQMALANTVQVLYKTYTCWVVCCFLKEIKRNDAVSKVIQRLPDHILDEFQGGSAKNGVGFGHHDYPYDEDFEVDLDKLTEFTRIGGGFQSVVYKAVYQSSSELGATVREVAVKVTRKSDLEHFVGQLKDLKVRIAIGNHENIAKFIGACTKNIRDLELHIVMELCSYGSLESYLTSRRGVFENHVDSNGELLRASSGKTRTGDTVTTFDLILWSIQAATGVSYLHSKNIIHNDVATRNMLITREKILKITDFGYSVPLGSAGAAKSKQTYVPLLWMAPETLQNIPKISSLSTKSDVWSFGVALWEVFTLCEQPYLEWTTGGYDNSKTTDFHKFSRTLSSGQIARPKFAPAKAFDILQKCWTQDRGARINLDNIVTGYTNMLSSSQPLPTSLPYDPHQSWANTDHDIFFIDHETVMENAPTKRAPYVVMVTKMAK